MKPFVMYFALIMLFAISIQAYTYFKWYQAASEEATRSRRKWEAIVAVVLGAILCSLLTAYVVWRA